MVHPWQKLWHVTVTVILVTITATITGQKLNGCSVEIIVDPFLQEHFRETFYSQRYEEMSQSQFRNPAKIS